MNDKELASLILNKLQSIEERLDHLEKDAVSMDSRIATLNEKFINVKQVMFHQLKNLQDGPETK